MGVLLQVVLVVSLFALPSDAARIKDVDVVFHSQQAAAKSETNSESQSEAATQSESETEGKQKEGKGGRGRWNRHNSNYGQGYDFGGWQPPMAQCNGQPNTWSVAVCLYNMAGGNLNSIFMSLAGPDGAIDQNEWTSRVAGTPAAIRIFITLASQEGAAGGFDDSSTVDYDDWVGFVNSAMSVSGGHMDASEWADYVSASVTAEALFDAANGHGGQYGFFGEDKLHDYEWAMAFLKCGGGDGSVTLMDLSRAIGLTPNDVHKVFKFIEDVGDGKCDRTWAYGFESHSMDESRIDQCEWNQLLEALKSDNHGYSWGAIGKGQFSASIAKTVTAYYKSHGYTRYHR